MPPKKNQTSKSKTKKSPLNQYKLPEIKKMAKSLGIVLGRKNKGQLIKEIEKKHHNRSKPNVKHIKINRSPNKRKKTMQINKVSREIIYDSSRGGKMIECINDDKCREIKLAPNHQPSASNIKAEPLFLPDVIDFVEKNEPEYFEKVIPRCPHEI